MITPDLRIILVFLVSLISSVFLIPKLSRIAGKIGLLDQPSSRKMHDKPKPLVGGLAMVIASTFSFLLFVPLEGLRGFFTGMAILLLIGFLDDFREIGSREKFLAQILATSIMFYLSKTGLSSFGDLLGLGPIDLPDNVYVQWLVTVFCVVGVCNSFNMIDGLDGLAGGLAGLGFLTFVILASVGGNTTVMLLNLALLGAVIGFLRFNWHSASVFMGDAGSLCLGFALSFMALVTTQGEEAVMKPVCALLILAVPIVDTVFLMCKRILQGNSPFKADKNHLHHNLVRTGFTKESSVNIILFLSFCFCSIAVIGTIWDIAEWILFLIFVVYCMIYILGSAYIIYAMRIGEKIISKGAKESAQCLRVRRLSVLKNLSRLRILAFFRKSSRFTVDLQVECVDKDSGKCFSGNVLNISSGGVMVEVNDLEKILETFILRIYFYNDNSDHVLELPAKHVWVKSDGEKRLHGFQFLEFDGEQKNVLFKLIVKSKKSEN